MVKILDDLSPEGRADLINEARILWSIGHPLVRLPVAFGQHEGRPALVLEHVPGRPLDTVPTSRELVERVFHDAAAALRSVHHAGIVHGDVKPGNLIVHDRGDVHLVDFGLSRSLEPSRTGGLGLAEAPGGTPAYQAPEVLFGGPLSPAADWFGLGAVLYEMRHGTPPVLRPLRPAGDDPLDQAIAGLLSEDPEQRVAHVEGWTEPGSAPVVRPFAGRDQELAALREWARLPGSALCHVTGPAHAGKSRLVRTAMIDHPLLVTRCYPFEMRPFGGLDWLMPLLEEPGEVGEWIAAQVEATGSTHGAALRARDRLATFGATRVVLIEDAQGLDPDAREFITVLVSRGSDLALKIVLESRSADVAELQPLLARSTQERLGYEVYRLRVAPRADAESMEQSALDLLEAGPDRSVMELLTLHPQGLLAPDVDRSLAALGITPPRLQRLRRQGFITDRDGRIVAFDRRLTDSLRASMSAPRELAVRRALLSVLVNRPYAAAESVRHVYAVGEGESAHHKATTLAEDARAVGAFDVAAEWFQLAREWLPAGGDPAELDLARASCLEDAGRQKLAAAAYLQAGGERSTLAAARCLLEAGDHAAGIALLDSRITSYGVRLRGHTASLVLRVVYGLLWLMVRGPSMRAEIRDEPDPASETRWMIARGYVMSEPVLCLALSLESARTALHAGDARTAGGALAFVGGGVFMQAPALRRWSDACLDAVRGWADGENDLLRASADLWTAVSGVGGGDWGRAERTLARVEPQLIGREGAQFERFLAAQTRLLLLQHQGAYGRLLDQATREVELARRRDDELSEVVMSLFAIDGFHAAGQLVPAAAALRRATEWLPATFVPQSFYEAEARINHHLATGDPVAGLEAHRELQAPFRRAFGHMAPVTKLRNAVLGGRAAILTGEQAHLTAAIASLVGLDRDDARAFLAWLEGARDGRSPDDLAARFEACGARALAAGVRLQHGEAEAAEALQRMGVRQPATWSAWMVPLRSPT